MSLPIELYEHPKVKAALESVAATIQRWVDHERESKCHASDWRDREGNPVLWGEAVVYLTSPGWSMADLGERLAELILSADESWCWDVAREVDRLHGEPLGDYFARVDAKAVAAAKEDS